MKRSLYTFAICCIAMSSVLAQGISFEHTTWQEALDKAKEENRLLFVDAYAQWCGPCKRMAKNEFTKSDVGEFYNSNFVNLKLDMETPNGRTFDAKYPVSAYPTMFFLDGDGNVVKKITGGKKGDQLIGMGTDVLKNVDFSKDWQEKYDAGDRAYETVYNYVKTLNLSNKSSLRIANDYLASDAEMTDEERFMFMVEAAAESDSKVYQEVIKRKDEAITLLGEEKYNKKIKKACMRTVDKAIKYEYQDLLDEAIANAEQGMTKGANEFKYKAMSVYAADMRDEEMYIKSIKGLQKLYKKKPKKLKALAESALNSKIKSNSVSEEAISIAKAYHKLEDSDESSMVYLNALMQSEDYNKALKLVKKSIKSCEDPKQMKKLENYQNIIEQKIEKS